MGVLRNALVLCLLFMVTGCATILAGRTQNISIDSSPQGARCELKREGRVIGTVEKTPGAIMVSKTKDDIDVKCALEGYEASTQFADSGTEGATYGNILLGGLIGWGVDSAAGADNKYPEAISVALAPSITPKTESPKASLDPAAIATTNPRSDLVDKITALKDLKDKGLLSQDEFESEKKELLAEF